MLILASQRQYLQKLLGEKEEEEDFAYTKRGAKPSFVEGIILSYVSGEFASFYKSEHNFKINQY